MEPSPGDNLASDSGPDVRPQRPRAARPKPAWPQPPRAWDRNPHGVAMLFLLLALGVYICGCLLFSRLTTGEYFVIDMFKAAGRQPLGALLLKPVSIFQVPLYAAVIALLLAALVTGVIIISQFYGVGWSLLFVLATAALAHLPLLGAALLGAALLANTRAIPLTNRFVKGLIALVLPSAAMWVSVSHTETLSVKPIEVVFLHFPWVAAVTTSAVAMMVFWLAARLLRYRSGLGVLCLASLVGLAVGTFYYGVGMDELAFRLLDRDHGLASPTDFCGGSVKAVAAKAAAEWKKEDGDGDGGVGLADIEIKGKVLEELGRSRAAVTGACEAFLRQFPRSRYCPYVRFLLARAWDMRADLMAVSLRKQVSYYDDIVSPQGSAVWRDLLVEDMDDPLAIVARAKLGQYLVATGKIEEGLQLLKDARALGNEYLARQAPQAEQHEEGLLSIFNIQPRDPVTPDLIREAVEPLAQWIWLIESNWSPQTDAADGRPLAELFALDPLDSRAHMDYPSLLRALVDKYNNGRLADNLRERRCMLAGTDEARAIELGALIRDANTGDDARCEATADLARLLSRSKDVADRRRAKQLWESLLESGTPFAEDARRALPEPGRALQPAPTTQP
ncbi:MAG: hypothetical protein BIFFINMI_01102 [Phycisphaerae bacterium]|nr:hypothetical protein [Phycisphaerae bacterium]